MQGIIGNMITWLVIIVVLATLGNNAVQLGKKDPYKKGKRQESLDDNYYIIQYSKMLKVIISIGLLFFIIVFLVNILTYLNICVLGMGIDAGTVFFFGLFLMFYVATFSGIVIWRVVVDDDEIIYRNYYGKTKRYTFNEISEVKELKNHKIIVYSKGRKIFAIDNNLPMVAYFKCTASEKGVVITYQSK